MGDLIFTRYSFVQWSVYWVSLNPHNKTRKEHEKSTDNFVKQKKNEQEKSGLSFCLKALRLYNFFFVFPSCSFQSAIFNSFFSIRFFFIQSALFLSSSIFNRFRLYRIINLKLIQFNHIFLLSNHISLLFTHLFSFYLIIFSF